MNATTYPDPGPRPSIPSEHTQPLVWGTVIVSILICVVISSLHIEQRNALNEAIRSLDTLRQSRIDLAEGFVQLTMSDGPARPFSRAQGRALLDQAMAAISEHAAHLDSTGAALAAYQKEAAHFHEQVNTWSATAQPSVRQTTALLISFHQLERQADLVDTESRAGLRRLSSRIDIAFTLFLSLAAILLAGICAALISVGHAQARTEQQRAMAERDLYLLNSELEQRVAERTAELERANHAKSIFFANISHELRTPLNAILGFTGTLLMKLPGPLTADQERQLGIIQRSARHLLALINDILDMTRIEAGRVEIRLEPVACQEVIDEVITHLRPIAEQKGLALTVVAPAQPVVVQSDRRALSQILINLVNNAIKFTDAGSVQIDIDDRQAGGQRQTLIRVADTGIGIRDSDIPQLFQEFGRISSPEVRQREGTGLGLRLSQRLAALIGGTIEVQSAYGIGSTFTLLLPPSV